MSEENSVNEPKNSGKKITKIELAAIGVIVLALLLYFLPKIMIGGEKKHDAILKTNAAIYTASVLEKFARAGKNPDIKAIAQEAANELNVTSKNPINKDEKAFTQEACMGCIDVQPDNELQSIIITGYDKNMKTVVRTVIKPPSFVTYTREEN